MMTWKEFKLSRRRALFEKLLSDPASGVPKMVQDRAQALAMNMVTNWLDHKRIAHCAMCPGTDTLVKHNDRYFCEPHKQFVLAMEEREQKKKEPVAA